LEIVNQHLGHVARLKGQQNPQSGFMFLCYRISKAGDALHGNYSAYLYRPVSSNVAISAKKGNEKNKFETSF